MTLQSSGTISLANIRDEYNNGSSDPVVLNDYYRGGSLVRANADNNTATNLSADIPTSANSSPLSINDFYGQARAFRKTYSSTATDQSGVGVFGDDFAVNYPKEIVINASQTVGATSSSAPALKIDSTGAGTITVTNNGSIEGAGGAASSAGGNALQVDGSVSVTLVNNGTIKAGGGGGGTGGTGGSGVYTASATFSSLVDQGGGGSSTPQNNKPSWLNSIYTSAGNLDGVGVVSDRLWRGINQQFNRSGGIGSSGQFQINHSGSAGAGFSGNCANRGPIYISAQTNITGVYTVSASISSLYGSGYGTPTVSVSTSTSSAGTSRSNSGTANITASTTTYFTGYGTASNGKNYYYNSLSMSVSGTCLAIQTGGSGGSGGVGQGYNQSAGSAGSGSSGSNNAGAGGAGGAGGAFGAAGSSGSTGNNGSGTSVSFPSSAPTNGAGGASGGASGKSIQGVSNVSSSGSGSLSGGTA